MSSSPSSRPRNDGGPTARCHSCGSRLRPEETWCSLCHQRVLAATPIEPDAGPAELAKSGEIGPFKEGTQASQPLVDRVGELLVDRVGEGLVDRVGEATVNGRKARSSDEADRLIAKLAAAEADRHRDSRLAALHGRFGTARGGVMLAGIGGVILLVIAVIGMTVLGLLL